MLKFLINKTCKKELEHIEKKNNNNNMLYNILYVFSVTVFAILLVYKLMIILSTSLRNGDDIFNIRRFVLNYIVRMSGHRTLFLNKEEDGDLCIEVLNSSNMKGRGIEYWFASPAWYPIFNIESVDGHVWKSTKMYFHTILKPLKICNIERFAHYVSEKLVNDVLSGKKACINSKDFSLMPAAIFHMFLFGSDISEDTSDIFYNASNEWRKHVAVKGHGDISIKLKMLHRVKDLIIYSGLYSHEIMSKAISLDPELLTAFIQPFFISSMINFSDIFVEVFKMLRQDRSGERHALQQLKNTCQKKSYLESFKKIEYNRICRVFESKMILSFGQWCLIVDIGSRLLLLFIYLFFVHFKIILDFYRYQLNIET